MTMRVSPQRLIVLSTAVVGLTLAASAPAAADDHRGIPPFLDDMLTWPDENGSRVTIKDEGLPASKPTTRKIDAGGGPASVQITCCRGDLPGPLVTVRITVQEEGLPAQKPRSEPALPPQVKGNTNVSDTRVVVTWQTN